jgi:hypothetical protein
MIHLGQLWSSLFKTLVKDPLKPFDPPSHSRTFAVLSKFHLNTSNSPNVKVVQFDDGHNFHVEWHLKFEVELGEKLGQHHLLLFIGAQKTAKLACLLCTNCWSKTHRAFVRVVEDQSIYNFAN